MKFKLPILLILLLILCTIYQCLTLENSENYEKQFNPYLFKTVITARCTEGYKFINGRCRKIFDLEVSSK